MTGFADAFAGLRQRFLDRCETDRATLEAHLAGPPLARDDLRLILHRLAGAAGTFGLPDLGDKAGAAEDALLEGAPDLPAHLTTLIAALTPRALQASANL